VIVDSILVVIVMILIKSVHNMTNKKKKKRRQEILHLMAGFLSSKRLEEEVSKQSTRD
jgi:hypothetical protein